MKGHNMGLIPGSKVGTNKTKHWSFYGSSRTGSKVRMNNTNHFYSSRQLKYTVLKKNALYCCLNAFYKIQKYTINIEEK